MTTPGDADARPRYATNAKEVARMSELRSGASMSESERRLRVDLAALYRIIAMHGWDDLLATHISVRLPGPQHHFLINPLGWLFDEITASSLVKVDLDGNVLEARAVQINPAGFTIHSAVHAARPDAQCVIHLHTIAGIAVASQAQGLLPLNQTAMLLNGRVAYHDFEGIALDLDERSRLIADLASKNAMILRNHGTLAVGSSVGDAFQTMYFLERACAIQVAAQSGSATLNIPPPSVQDVVTHQTESFGDIADRLLWPAMLRRLDRFDRSYRK
jgi:ribulose-5-phosphate 4-epimerase/fuculose-1-phosphate aldolase